MASSSASVAPASSDPREYRPRYIDIGINLADPIFRGIYHGRLQHQDDLNDVIDRAKQVGCTKLIVTGSSFKSSREALSLASEYPGTVFATAGIHPCSSSIFTVAHKRSHEEDIEDGPVDATADGPDPEAPKPNVEEMDLAKSGKIISDLRRLIDDARSSGKSSALAAFGEFGLDYDRLHFCGKTAQLHSFREQLALAASLNPQLPLFLHSRASHEDFVALLKEAFGPKLARLEKGGVVHSFTGSVEEMRELMELGLYIGVNGCSFKTAENCDVVKEIRLDRLMIETDGPWCEIRPSHEGYQYLLPPKSVTANGHASEESAAGKGGKKKGGKGQQEVPKVPDTFKTVKKEKWEQGAMVKGRNEPCMIERVAEIIAKIKGETLETVCEAAWANTVKVFGIEDKRT